MLSTEGVRGRHQGPCTVRRSHVSVSEYGDGCLEGHGRGQAGVHTLPPQHRHNEGDLWPPAAHGSGLEVIVIAGQVIYSAGKRNLRTEGGNGAHL